MNVMYVPLGVMTGVRLTFVVCVVTVVYTSYARNLLIRFEVGSTCEISCSLWISCFRNCVTNGRTDRHADDRHVHGMRGRVTMASVLKNSGMKCDTVESAKFHVFF